MANGPSVRIKEKTGKYFVVEHTYWPKPNVEEPTSFDPRSTFTNKVGVAETRAEAEQIQARYLAELEGAREKEGENDDEEDEG
jgi:hypothetical protein